jgi:hypothetical protein
MIVVAFPFHIGLPFPDSYNYFNLFRLSLQTVALSVLDATSTRFTENTYNVMDKCYSTSNPLKMCSIKRMCMVHQKSDREFTVQFIVNKGAYSLILGVCILLRVWDQGESVFRLRKFNIKVA